MGALCLPTPWQAFMGKQFIKKKNLECGSGTKEEGGHARGWQSPLEAPIWPHPTGNLRDSVGHTQSVLTMSERAGAFLTLHR